MTAAKKTTYTPAKRIRSITLSDADGSTKLVIMLTEGKSGYNTKATIRSKDDGVETQTGGRGSFQSEADGITAFDKLVAEAREQGWTVSGGAKNAFTTIPAPPSAQPGSLKKPAQRAAARK